MAWSLGLGFVLTIVIIGCVIAAVASQTFQGNWRVRQHSRRAMKVMKFKAELARKGTDPEYVKFLEKEAFKEER
jgi:hypothetical protein